MASLVLKAGLCALKPIRQLAARAVSIRALCRAWVVATLANLVLLNSVFASEPNQASALKNQASPFVQVGKISYYAKTFEGRLTANGERYDSTAMTMAHRTLPFGTLVRVKNLSNRRSVVLRVNDRGPFKQDRVADVSLMAAKQLGMLKRGLIRGQLTIELSEKVQPKS